MQTIESNETRLMKHDLYETIQYQMKLDQMKFNSNEIQFKIKSSLIQMKHHLKSNQSGFKNETPFKIKSN